MAFIIRNPIGGILAVFSILRETPPLGERLSCVTAACSSAVSFFRSGTRVFTGRTKRAKLETVPSPPGYVCTYFNDVSSSLCPAAPYMAVPYRRNHPLRATVFTFWLFILSE